MFINLEKGPFYRQNISLIYYVEQK